jgi:hypothetical protein
MMKGNTVANKKYINCRFRAELEVRRLQQLQWGSTGKHSAIGNCIYFRMLDFMPK